VNLQTGYCGECESLQPFELRRLANSANEEVLEARIHGGNPRWVHFECKHRAVLVVGSWQDQVRRPTFEVPGFEP